jgi:molybdenum cofactor guanylyltransferase
MLRSVTQTGPNSAVTLAVLAGGRSTRMGMPKTGVRLGETPMLGYLLKKLRWEGPTLLVTAPGREHPDGAELFDSEVADPVKGEGPLRGVLTALENCRTELVCVLTTDMPLIRKEHLEFLVNELVTANSLHAVMTARLEGGERRIEPFPLTIRPAASTAVADHLAAGFRSVHSLSKLAGFGIVAPSWEDQVWTNLNTPEDVRDFLETQGNESE